MTEQLTDWSSLFDECISHLEMEYQTLVDLNTTLQEIGIALRNHDLVQLEALVEKKEQQMLVVQTVREQRKGLRERISLAIPDETEISIARWAESLDEIQKKAVLDLRNQLMDVANQARRQARTNQIVVARGLRLLNQAIGCLSGQCGSSNRYSAEGSMIGDTGNQFYVSPPEIRKVPLPKSRTAATSSGLQRESR